MEELAQLGQDSILGAESGTQQSQNGKLLGVVVLGVEHDGVYLIFLKVGAPLSLAR
jgi:hypothetical protein